MTVDDRTRQLALYELDDLVEVEEGLSGYELGFVESMCQKVDDGGTISDREVKKIHEVWDKVCK